MLGPFQNVNLFEVPHCYLTYWFIPRSSYRFRPDHRSAVLPFYDIEGKLPGVTLNGMNMVSFGAKVLIFPFLIQFQELGATSAFLIAFFSLLLLFLNGFSN